MPNSETGDGRLVSSPCPTVKRVVEGGFFLAQQYNGENNPPGCLSGCITVVITHQGASQGVYQWCTYPPEYLSGCVPQGIHRVVYTRVLYLRVYTGGIYRVVYLRVYKEVYLGGVPQSGYMVVYQGGVPLRCVTGCIPGVHLSGV